MVTYSYEVVPTGWPNAFPEHGTLDDLLFDPFVMEVPGLDFTKVEEQRNARRAYFSAFTILGQQGVEPEEFQVFEWTESFGRGREVNREGLIDTWPDGSPDEPPGARVQ